MAINGDCALAGLGLNLIDRQILITNVQLVFHAAATVRFDEKLKLAVSINVCGTQEVLELCTHMTKLEVWKQLDVKKLAIGYSSELFFFLFFFHVRL